MNNIALNVSVYILNYFSLNIPPYLYIKTKFFFLIGGYNFKIQGNYIKINCLFGI